MALSNPKKKPVNQDMKEIAVPAPQRKRERFRPERFDFDIQKEHNIETIILESKPVPNPPKPRE